MSSGQTPLRNGRSVIAVEPVSPHVPRERVLALFNALTASIEASRFVPESNRLEIIFSSPADAKKALELNGYALGDRNRLCVKPLSGRLKPTNGSPQEDPDSRRNLYVLGIPFALSKAQFASMFLKHGRVLHCVILATVDNSSRRRGFVVMSSHEEAKRAMDALSNKALPGGHILDISWAVVQRSKGFLDGGDREVFQDTGLALHRKRLDEPIVPPSFPASSILSPPEKKPSPTPLVSCRVPTSILLIKNLPKMLFSSTADVQPLLYPYGRVNKFEFVPPPEFLKDLPATTVSVIAEYAGLSGALQALEGLQGQCYDNVKLSVEFLKPSFGRTGSSALSSSSSKPKILSVINCHTLDFRNNASKWDDRSSSIPTDTFALAVHGSIRNGENTNPSSQDKTLNLCRNRDAIHVPPPLWSSNSSSSSFPVHNTLTYYGPSGESMLAHSTQTGSCWYLSPSPSGTLPLPAVQHYSPLAPAPTTAASAQLVSRPPVFYA